ncbi:MAG: DNA polymerase IV [Pseudomonadota bacterium]
MPTLCRDCFHIAADGAAARCRKCASPRVVSHDELAALTIAHVDCDAFFAAVEKRDDPSLRDVPVIIGGGRRGVVSTCCYLARIHGVRSAMPMFKALKACPEAVVVRPNFEKYVTAGRAVRHMMQALTPLVQPLSIDEAFLDLSGTEKVHRAPPAGTLARFARNVEDELGITVSIGLAPNKFLAKFASDAEKPRGFTVIGTADAKRRLAHEPVTRLPGVGPAAAARIERAGIRLIGDLQARSMANLMETLGSDGQRLFRLANGEDARRVDPQGERKSLSAEQTFDADLSDRQTLLALLRHLSEKVSTRLKAADLAGRTVTLKLKTPDFKNHTRAETLAAPTALAHRIFSAGKSLLLAEADGRRFRLIGIGVSHLTAIEGADADELFDPYQNRLGQAERAMDDLRARFGEDAIATGLALSRPRRGTSAPQSTPGPNANGDAPREGAARPRQRGH